MSADFCILLIQGWTVSFLLLSGIAGLLFAIALMTLLLSRPHHKIAKDQIRHIGTATRVDIKHVVETYQNQVREILTKKE